MKARPVLWTPGNPKLYKVEIELDGQRLTDEIGFRTIETRGKQILLNGKPIFLRGISIHEEAPYRQGRAHTTEDAHILLTWAKELGCNYVRLAHYPHNELAVREAERMGIMVWSEIPVYWTISWQNEGTFNNARQQLHDMIRRDHNRAAIIIWSIANETPHSDARDQFLGKLAEYARTQDNTRLISMAMEVTGASNYVNRLQDNMNKFVDVVSFNEYVGWYRDVHDAPRMTWEVPYEKPVIISEWGGGALAGNHGSKEQRWTEEFQENLYRENIARKKPIPALDPESVRLAESADAVCLAQILGYDAEVPEDGTIVLECKALQDFLGSLTDRGTALGPDEDQAFFLRVSTTPASQAVS